MEENEAEIRLTSQEDLDIALIQYALQPNRLLFVDNPACWHDFHGTTKKNFDEYFEYTPYQLCEHFLRYVLPRIYEYNLNDTQQRHLLQLFHLHPSFQITDNGFARKKEFQKIDFTSEALNDDDDIFTNPPDDFSVAIVRQNLNHQIIFTENEADFNSEQSLPQLSAESAALFSVCLSPDSVLSICERISQEDVLTRLRQAKRMFEQSGLQLQNVSITIDTLLEKVKTVRELKETLEKLVNNVTRSEVQNQ